MKPTLSLLTACLILSACGYSPSRPDSAITPPATWQSPYTPAQQEGNRQWWQTFASPDLNKLIGQARSDSYDIAAAVARIRQAQAGVVIAGGSQLPEVKTTVNASRQKLLRGKGYSELDSTDSNKAVNTFDATLSASYEVDFWGSNAATRESALQTLHASEFDRATVELTLLSQVADNYMQALALRERSRIAELNLANARNVLEVVKTRYQAGSATALELAQQEGLVATQQRQLPLLQQQAQEAQTTLAALVGQPVQNIALGNQAFNQLHWPDTAAGIPSELLSRRPDIANAEAKLAAAQADLTVARAAMLPALTLTASIGSGANRAPDVLRSPFYNLAAGLAAPIFNNGRLGAERDKARARQEELLQTYRASIINAFADTEKALNAIAGIDQQQRWQDEEVRQADLAFRIAESRYKAGAEALLIVLDTQRTLYQAQDLGVQLRLQRLQASIALYKALGGGWSKSG